MERNRRIMRVPPSKPVFMHHVGTFSYLKLHAYIDVSMILKTIMMIRLFLLVASGIYLFDYRT